MPRHARLIMDNVCYHIITRGNQKQAIFRDQQDFNVYLKYILKYKMHYNFKIYAWCLMINHVHMVIESLLLSKVMHGINLSYAQYFKYKYESVGHFWQDRFKSFVVQKDRYLIDCINYIEYNPVRAELVAKPEDYKWTSYKARVLGKNNKLLDHLIL